MLMKSIILRCITNLTRLLGDDWRAVGADFRKKFKYTQTMCYLEIK